MISGTKPRLLSILNTAAFLINASETFGFGPFSSHFSGYEFSPEQVEKWQTIVHPSLFSFVIWAVIFLMQAIFCYVCNVKGEEYSAHPLVVDGISYYYLLACLAQTLWSPAFGYEHMYLAAACMGGVLISLTIIAIKQNEARKNAMEGNPQIELAFGGKYYWLLQFTFELYLGWVMTTFLLSVNVIFIAEQASSSVQVVVAALSLLMLAAASLRYLYQEVPIYTIPSVTIWTTFWICFELHNPAALILDTFSSSEIKIICYESIGLFFVLTYCCVWKKLLSF